MGNSCQFDFRGLIFVPLFVVALKIKIKYPPGFRFNDPLDVEYLVHEIRWRGDPHPIQYMVVPTMSLNETPAVVEEEQIDAVILHRQFLPAHG